MNAVLRRVGVVAVIVGPRTVLAQRAAFDVGAGVAVPSGSLAAARGSGPFGVFGVTLGSATRPLGLRFEVDAAQFSARRLNAFESYSAMQVHGALAMLQFRTGGHIRVHTALGGGLAWARGAAEVPEPNGVRQPQFAAGVGVDLPVGQRARVGLDAGFHALLGSPSYGARRGESTVTWWPVSLRVSF